jgi:hypothetical protein
MSLIPAILAQADYIIDDTNSTISYIGLNFNRATFNAPSAQLFNNTA